MENEMLLINALRKDMHIELEPKNSSDQIKAKLADHVNLLINDHFEELVNLLYKIDVNENRLRKLLKENTEANAANIIADLIIERQLQKIKTRSESKNSGIDPGNEEKW
jgi:hypothetical protein